MLHCLRLYAPVLVVLAGGFGRLAISGSGWVAFTLIALGVALIFHVMEVKRMYRKSRQKSGGRSNGRA